MRKAYIDNNDYDSFFNYLANLKLPELEGETIPTEKALERITERAVFAKVCDPVYNAAAMDGIAVVAEQTAAACEQTPLKLTLGEDFVYINTGGALSGKYNSVIMIEDVLEADDKTVFITAPSYPWQHVRVKGESIVEGEIVLPKNRRIRPVDIGAIIASGNLEVCVKRKPRVGIIPTGDEMVESVDLLEAGKLMESNGKMFAALAEELDSKPRRYPICPDNLDLLIEAVKLAASENDLVIVNAGSSAGTKDFAVHAIERIGKVKMHGFAIKPGKPTILGEVDGKPVLGIPGYPVSAYLVFELFAKPIICKYYGEETPAAQTISATLTRKLTSSFKNAELIRMSVGEVDGKLVSTPLERGAAQIMSLVKANGLLFIDRLKEGVEAGELVDIELKTSISQIKKQLVIVGSHDMIIDILMDKLPLTSAHVGSMGGVMAMLRGECHIAPIHLLDEELGEYNIPQIHRYFKGQSMALIKGVGRTQGLIVKRGNPKNITTYADLIRPDVRFANRQRGSGTRLLLDFNLKQFNLSPQQINGYEKEYNTHLAVAVAVDNEAADVGLGVYSAAANMNMDFIPLSTEEYDFLTTAARLDDRRLKDFIALLRSDDFKKSLDDLGGYTYENIGKIIAVEG